MDARTPEHERLAATRAMDIDWKAWGPYLSDRAWGTVREDYSANGDAWNYFPHDHARSRVYRWNEDGLAGISDRGQRLCFAIGLWNGNDAILKERLFGLTGPEGNHGEDVKEYYFHLDSTPTHSYMKMLYKYPQRAFPYADLVAENQRRDRSMPEYELLDTGIFDDDRYWDVFIEYAKAAPDDILIRITAFNRGPERATLDILGQVWFRDRWSWNPTDVPKPRMTAQDDATILIDDAELGLRRLYVADNQPFLFTENATNTERVYGSPSTTPFVKDAFHAVVCEGQHDRANPAREGTKAASWHRHEVDSGASTTVELRLTDQTLAEPFANFDAVFAQRIAEADAFYGSIQPPQLSDDERSVQRQAFAGLMWNKQWYYYEVETWLKGDKLTLPPPTERLTGRNSRWEHLAAHDIISMPDKWEYPWFAAWDLAFHCISIALIDPDLAKRQLTLMLREWYMSPSGQIPAYEWAFGDVNPPVHAWSCWRVYKIDKKQNGVGDTVFLERMFHKLLLNFTWWVNRKDAGGNNVFEGGFLGLDNIGVFDRSAPLPNDGRLEQSDATSWMGMYCLNLMTIALELATTDVAYEDVATKFFEHFMYIARAMNNIGDQGIDLWDEQDEFFYDVLHLGDGQGGTINFRLRLRSMVGLIPLFAVETLDPDILDKLPRFKRRLEWFLGNRPGCQVWCRIGKFPARGRVDCLGYCADTA